MDFHLNNLSLDMNGSIYFQILPESSNYGCYFCIYVLTSAQALVIFFVFCFFYFLPRNYVQNNLHVTVSASIAAAVVWMSELPARLNPVILPLMAAVKREQVRISSSAVDFS